jgi:hypothetical protein
VPEFDHEEEFANMTSLRLNSTGVTDREWRAAVGAMLLVVLFVPTGPTPAQTGAHQPPDLEGFLLFRAEQADGDGDGVEETHIVRYRNAAGDSVFSMTTKGQLWAWSLKSGAPGDTDPGRNYVLRDSDCDGSFDELYGLSDEFRVPDCLK